MQLRRAHRPHTLHLWRCLFLLLCFVSVAQEKSSAQVRSDIRLDLGWRTLYTESATAPANFEQPAFDDRTWQAVSTPHNWEQYAYDHQEVHGTRYGSAFYRNHFKAPSRPNRPRSFLYFEGVAAYATVWVNGRLAGTHAGGLTTFTLDITDAIRPGQDNVIALRADNPSKGRDLPWVAGDGSDVLGFAEGSQPLGIFRPVHLVQTGSLRVEPFGVDIWNGTDITADSATLHLTTEVRNYAGHNSNFSLTSDLLDRSGHVVATVSSQRHLPAGATVTLPQQLPAVRGPHLWSLEQPYLYCLRTTLREHAAVIDTMETDYGIRWISWPPGDGKGGVTPGGQFFLNGKPVSIRGIAEYEHLLGGGHSFSDEQVEARVHQVEAAGFNAFRDGHYPHNLRYQRAWDHDGLLWWTQFSAHIYFDNPAFRANFKRLLADWVKERRNSPSLILWGLQNESVLPTDFAEEATEIIRKLDPTTSTQRKVTTCNFGTGTDWNVPQNWSGTYSGNLDRYAEELKQEVLVGEYGAWRSLGLHEESATAASKLFSEDRMTSIMETKVRLAEEAAPHSAGQFAWLLNSHENPGRLMKSDGTQLADGNRDLDHIGPVNNKGLLTLWDEPLDVFYMYRANYVPATTQPMVYIAMHTWPDRWTHPGLKSGIAVYSNCDEVELFNDLEGSSLGIRKRGPIGTHFEWNDVNIQYNILRAICRVSGKDAARDIVKLDYLPDPPNVLYDRLRTYTITDPLTPEPGTRYLYRVHTGGATYRDRNGYIWQADQQYTPTAQWGYTSWAESYPKLDPEFGSRRTTSDLIEGTLDPLLFQQFRYGREQLSYTFRVPNGDYRIELYMVEPWYGRAGIDATGWRLFDVAVNGNTVLHNLDIFHEAGFNRALKKVVKGTVKDGRLVVSFPRVAAGQAILSAIAISADNPWLGRPLEPTSTDLIQNLHAGSIIGARRYLANGDELMPNIDLAGLPTSMLDADWIPLAQDPFASLSFTAPIDETAFLLHDASLTSQPEPPAPWHDTGLVVQGISRIADIADKTYRIFERPISAGAQLSLVQAETVLVKRALPSPIAANAPARPAILYPADQATLTNATLTGKLIRLQPGASSIRWRFATGISGSYRMLLKYDLAAGEDAFATARILDEQGNEVDSAPIHLTGPETAGAKLKPIAITVTLNAGNYNLVIQVKDSRDLSIESLQVQ